MRSIWKLAEFLIKNLTVALISVFFFHAMLEAQSTQPNGAPTLAALAPAAGVLGVTVTVSGAGFGNVQGSSVLALNNISLTITSWSDASIRAVIPQGASSGAVSITLNGSTTVGPTFTLVDPHLGIQAQLTIPAAKVSNSDQINFPLLISGTYQALASAMHGGGVLNLQGYDIIFTTDSGGRQLLDSELENYDPNTGSISYWVRLPVLSHVNDTTIYMWYGIPGISESQTNPAGVWGGNYAGVWHFPSSGSVPKLVDSSGNDGVGTNNGTTAGLGKIGGGLMVSDAGYVTIGTPSALANLAQKATTFSAWIKSSSGNGGVILGKDDNNSSAGWSLVENPSSHQVEFLTVYSGHDFRATSLNSLGNDTWNYVSISLLGNASSESTASIYIDGVLDSTVTGGTGTTDDDSSQVAYIANATYGDQSSTPLSGMLDEVRISSQDRSADWIKTEYNNQANPDTFYSLSFGGTVSGSNPTAAPIFSPAAGSYTSDQLISISDTTPNSKIVYTTDGTTPNSTSALYIDPIHISNSVTLKALALSPDGASSGLSTAAYIISSPPPTFAALAPAAGVPGVTVTVSGAGFGNVQGSSILTLNNTALTITSWTDTSIRAVIPQGASSGAVSINLTGSTTVGPTFTLVDPHLGIQAQLTIPAAKVSNSDQINFPLLISGTYQALASATQGGGVLNLQGYDIIFTADSGGQQLLDSELENYDPSTGGISYWVRLPVLSHVNDTTIYVWYGIPGITESQTNPVGVWGGNYAGVWHFPPSGSVPKLADSSGNDGVGTNNGTAAGLGKIGGGLVVNNAGYVTVGTPSALSNLAQKATTFSAWIKSSPGNGGIILGKDDNNSSAGWSLVENPSSHQVEFLTVYSGHDFRATSANSLGNDTWNYVSISLLGNASSESTASIYIDGVLDSTVTGGTGTTDDDSSQVAYIANATYGDQSSTPLSGMLDEVRISSQDRSADWIKTEYNNQANPDTFYNLSFSGIVSTPLSITTFSPNPAQPGVDLTITGTAFGQTQGSSEVTLNEMSLLVRSWNDTTVVVGLPSNATSGNLVLREGGGQSSSLQLPIGRLLLSTILPSAGLHGVHVVLTGSGFGATQGVSVVSLGGETMSVLSWTDSKIIVVIPQDASSGNIMVTLGGVSSNSLNFTVADPTSGLVMPITVYHKQVINSDQVNFPLLVSGTYEYLATVANGGNGHSDNGYDIVFTSDAAGKLLLDFEVDQYSPITGAVDFWVRIPNLSHTVDTTIYMWYAIPGITESQENRGGVWVDGYKGVWHVAEGQTLSLPNSAQDGESATNFGSIATAGQIGTALAVTNGAYASIGSPTELDNINAGASTFSLWVNIPAGSGGVLLSKGDGINSGWSLEQDPATRQLKFYQAAGYKGLIGVSTSAVNSDIWTLVTVTLTPIASGGVGVAFYINGVLDSLSPYTGPMPGDDSNQAAYLLNNQSGNSFSGAADEIRISSVARSSDWIATEFANQLQPNSFYWLGSNAPGTTSLTPIIDSVSPNPVAAGGKVMILGSGFGTSQGNSSLTLNSSVILPSSWSDTAIALSIPANATSGEIVFSDNDKVDTGAYVTVYSPSFAGNTPPPDPVTSAPEDDAPGPGDSSWLSQPEPIALFLTDPFLLPNYDQGPISQDNLVVNYWKAPAVGMVVDGISTAIAVYVSPDDLPVTFSADTDSGATLLPWDPAFLQPALGSALPKGGSSVTGYRFKSGDLYYSLALVVSPPAFTRIADHPSLTVTAVETLSEGGNNGPIDQSLVLFPRPVIFMHGLWGNGGSLGKVGTDVANYLQGGMGTWIHQWEINYACYSKKYRFSQENGSSDACEGTSHNELNRITDKILTALNQLRFAYSVAPSSITDNLDINYTGGIVGGQIDIVAHSMGGLATRYHITRPGYNNVTNRMQGAFNTVVTLDTPELGSNLANYLLQQANAHHNDSLVSSNLLWSGCQFQDMTHPIANLGDCMQALGMPLGPEDSSGLSNCPDSSDANAAADPEPNSSLECGAVSSIRVNSPQITALPPIPQLSGGWIVIASTYPDDADRQSGLRVIVQDLVNSINAGNGPTVSSLVGSKDNDVIVSLASQSAGVLNAPIPFSPVAHSPVPAPQVADKVLALLGAGATSNSNVEESSVIDTTVICSLLSAGDYSKSVACASSTNPVAASTATNAVSEQSSVSEQLAQAPRESEKVSIPRSHITLPIVIEYPGGPLILAQPNRLSVKLPDADLESVFLQQEAFDTVTNKTRHAVRGGEANLQILGPAGDKYIVVTPMEAGKIRFIVRGFSDGEKIFHNGNVVVDVIPPPNDVEDLHVNSSGSSDPDPGLEVVRLSTDPKTEGHTKLYISATYRGLAVPVTVPGSFASFQVRGSSEEPSIRVDKNGSLTALKRGHDLVETTYGGKTALTCVDVEGLGGAITYNRRCNDLLRRGEHLTQ